MKGEVCYRQGITKRCLITKEKKSTYTIPLLMTGNRFRLDLFL